MCDFAIGRKLIAAGLSAELSESLDGECCFHAPIACSALNTQFCRQFFALNSSKQGSFFCEGTRHEPFIQAVEGVRTDLEEQSIADSG